MVFYLEDDERTELMPYYKEAIDIFILNHDINCAVIDKSERELVIACGSLADMAALQIGFTEKTRIKEPAYKLYAKAAQYQLFPDLNY